MKVGGDIWTNGHIELDRSKTAGKTENYGGSFQGLLDQEVTGSGCTSNRDNAAAIAPSGNVCSFPGVWSFDQVHSQGCDPSLLASVDRLDNGLEKVATKLGDEDVSLKGIQDVLSALDEGSKEMGTALQSTMADHPLRQVGEDLSVLAYVESLKWKRGDYL